MGDTTGAAAKEKPKVLQLGQLDHAHSALASLSEIATILAPTSADPDSFRAECASGAFDGISIAFRTFDSYSITGPITASLLAVLPSTLRFICHLGAGYDQIDVAACTAAGVRVSNVPTAVDDATADAAVFLMLGALRNLNVSMVALREGNWRTLKGEVPALGHDPQGKILGILGMGGIGRNLARKAKVFGMRIRYHNRTRLSEESEREEAAGAEYVDFGTLLRESDVLSLNLPLNPATRHIISAPQFALMKPGVVIVNTARGAVMDEAALVDALAAGQVGSVGLDVFEDEPNVHPNLLENPNVMLVPHMGTYTVETQLKMEEWMISNVVMAVKEGRLRSIVPEQRDTDG